MNFNISLELSDRLPKAFSTSPTTPWIFDTYSSDSSASFLISSATTAKPLPASPALAASMAAFNASRFV